MRRSFALLLLMLGCRPAFLYAMPSLPDRAEIDSWLGKLGDDDSFDPTKSIDWGLVPGPFYTPELGLGIGALAVGIYRPDKSDNISQNSSLSFSSFITSTGAVGLGFVNRSFLSNDQWRIVISGDLSDSPTYFWGSGFSAGRKNDKQKYTSQNLALRPGVFYRLAPALYLGLGWSFSSVHAVGIEDKTGTNSLHQQSAGPSVLSSGVDIALAYDTRDFVANPQRGQLFGLQYTQYSPESGSDTRFNEIDIHYSTYHAIASQTVLAWELYGQFTQGNPPWNMLPELGDTYRMRGYYQGRYRDRNAISTQLEYRQKLDWRNGVVGWVGGGTMSPRPGELGSSSWLPSVGVGYRFEFKPQMNVRLDYGIGKGSSGFYFQAGEAF